MLKLFKEYSVREKLFKPTDSILLAVSGGSDSVAMCELFYQAGVKFGIAHCNFGLRGAENNGDAKFVSRLASNYKVPYFTKKFQTKTYSRNNKISIQMGARKLRYDWFEEIRRKEKFNLIATAHHQNDMIETFFINLIRGTGIAGLRSIEVKRDKIIRPLLFCTKQEILNFISVNNLGFREDSSNNSDNYLRNKIRHQFIPLLKEFNPSIEYTLNENIERLQNVEIIYNKEINIIKKKLVIKKNGYYLISLEEFNKDNLSSFHLFELLKPFNFNFPVVKDILKDIKTGSGKIFYSSSHQLLKDRKSLLIKKLGSKTQQSSIHQPLIKFKKINPSEKLVSKLSNEEFFDFDKLKFPLEIRKWKNGDIFYPLGMQGKKKLSDFFINQKINRFEKENIYLLLSDKKIVWVIGKRIDDRFKVTSETKKIYFAEIVY